MAFILMCGVEVLVDLCGNALLRPQSPRCLADAGVVMACRIGYGRVAVSDDRRIPVEVMFSSCGCGNGGGSEKSLDERNNLPVGELKALDMTPPVCPSRLRS